MRKGSPRKQASSTASPGEVQVPRKPIRLCASFVGPAYCVSYNINCIPLSAASNLTAGEAWASTAPTALSRRLCSASHRRQALQAPQPSQKRLIRLFAPSIDSPPLAGAWQAGLEAPAPKRRHRPPWAKCCTRSCMKQSCCKGSCEPRREASCNSPNCCGIGRHGWGQLRRWVPLCAR